MNKKIANYSIVLLVFVFGYGLYQAAKQNKIPFVQDSTISDQNEKTATISNENRDTKRDKIFNIQSSY